MSIGIFVSGTVLCVFLGGAGIIGATRTQDMKVDLQFHDPRCVKEHDLGVQDAESK